MGNELIPSHSHTPQIIQLRKSKFRFITWDQTFAFVLQVYFTDTGEYDDSPTTGEAALVNMSE